MSVTYDFKGLCCIITGGGSGIGRETALSFALAGANVVVGDICPDSESEVLALFKKRRKATSGELVFMGMDAGKEEDCAKLVATAIERFGEINIVFNNVGIQDKEFTELHNVSNEDWHKILTVNLDSYFWISKLFLQHHLSKREQQEQKTHTGVIINNASIQGLQSQEGVSAYAASKGAILSLTRQLSVEYGKYDVRVNAVSPGSIQTPLLLSVMPQACDYARSNTPLGKLGEVEDVANTVLFLASNAAKHITGQNIVVCGGITAKGGWFPLHNKKAEN